MVPLDIQEHIQNDYIYNELSKADIMQKYGIKSNYLVTKIIGKENIRSISDAAKIAHKKKSEHFKHSEETKQKLRQIRLTYMKAHPEQTAWRKNNSSYIENLFSKILQETKLDKKYKIVKEYSVFPYYIDFAFVDIKVAIELDGSQHLLADRKLSDEKKDMLLLNKGWRILRITENEIKTNYVNISNVVLDFINDEYVSSKQVGIFSYTKKYEKVKRDDTGLTEKQKIQHFNNRKVKDRPDKDTLETLVCNNSILSIGRLYNVSDNTIRKWCKLYGIQYKKK